MGESARVALLQDESWHHALREVLLYGVIGVAATVVYFLVGLVLLHVGGASAPIASFLSYPVSTMVSYFGHRRLTFQSSASHARTLPHFLGISLCGLALSYSIPWALTERLGLPPLFSFCVVIFIGLFVFLTLKYYVFRGSRSRSGLSR
jgi:putative flippase GtrA